MKVQTISTNNSKNLATFKSIYIEDYNFNKKQKRIIDNIQENGYVVPFGDGPKTFI